MKTISRVIAILGLTTFVGGIPVAVKAQPSDAALLSQNNLQQASDSGVRRFFAPADYPQAVQEYNANTSLGTGESLVYNYDVVTACAEARDNPATIISANHTSINDGFSSAGRQLTTRAVVNCNNVAASNNNTAASLTKEFQAVPVPSYQPFYVIRLGDTIPLNYRQRGDAMIQTPVVRF